MNRILLTLALLAACKGGGPLFGDTGGGLFNRDRDDDTGGGGDDSDDTEAPAECDEELDESPPGGPDCYTGTLACGDSLTATTVGGSEVMDGDLYEEGYCFVPFEDYDAAERAYLLEVPEDTMVTLTADFGCQDMAVVAMLWSDEDTCPYEGSGVFVCEGKGASGAAELLILPDDRDSLYVVVVDAPAGQEGVFTLDVLCESR